VVRRVVVVVVRLVVRLVAGLLVVAGLDNSRLSSGLMYELQRSEVQRQAEIRADVGVSEMSLGVHEEEGRRGSLTVPRRIEVEKHSRT
jgi:hypothetical protein